MLTVPSDIIASFDTLLRQQATPKEYYNHYQKWLRYYFDFCYKYHHPTNNPKSKPLFIEKLKTKNQPDRLREQAAACRLIILSSD